MLCIEDVKILSRFKELILLTCGFSLEMGREQTLINGLSKRMASCGIDKAEAYHELLIRDKSELNSLVELLTVNETYFFREPDHLNLALDKLVPTLLKGRLDRPLRILSAGCSTGEEPYSIAMMLHEKYGAESSRLFAVTGVDIDSFAIASARNGIYGKSSFRGMEQNRVNRYFEPCGTGEFRVNDSIRNQVGFEVVNLLDTSYPPRMLMPDIIFYRNVSIYFPVQVQRDIFNRLADILTEGGYLLVGATETLHHNIGILSLEEQESLFYYQKRMPPPLFIEERRKQHRHPPISSPAREPQKTAAGAPAFGRNAAREPSYTEQPLPTRNEMRGRFDQALDLARNNQQAEAFAMLDTLIKQDDSFVKAHSLKGSLLLSASRLDEAAAVCTHAIGRDPLCIEAYLMLGIIARRKGNDDEAFKRFREAIYLDSSCWLAHFHTAEILYGMDPKRARQSYETTARILANGSLKEHGQAFFPLSVNAEQFTVICRHKLSLLKEK